MLHTQDLSAEFDKPFVTVTRNVRAFIHSSTKTGNAYSYCYSVSYGFLNYITFLSVWNGNKKNVQMLYIVYKHSSFAFLCVLK